MGGGIFRVCGMGCGCCGEGRDYGADQLQYDPEFKGPVISKKRWPTDVPCLLLFLVFLGLMLAVGIYSWVEGHPQRLINPVDSKGRICGVDDGVEHKPNLLFFDLSECIYVQTSQVKRIWESDEAKLFACPTTQVCVDSCPGRNHVAVRDRPVCVDGVDARKFRNVTDEDYDLQDELADLVLAGKCAPYYLDSSELAGRCVPTVFTLDEKIEDPIILVNDSVDPDLKKKGIIFKLEAEYLRDIRDGTLAITLLLNGKQFLLDVFHDFAVVWPGLLLGVLGCVFLCIFYLFLLRYCTALIVWGALFLVFVLLLAIMIASWYQFAVFVSDDVADDSTVADDHEIINELNEELDWWEYQEIAWLIIAILSTLGFVLLVLAIIFLRKRIWLSITLIKVASKAVGTVPSTMFYPVITWLLLIAVFVYWVLVAVCLVTSSDPDFIEAFNDSLSLDDIDYLKRFYNMSFTNNSDCNLVGNFTNGSISLITETGRMVTAKCVFEEFHTDDFLNNIQLFHVFGLFWLSNFILALGECVLAGAFATYYWTFKKENVPSFSVFTALVRTLIYHSGSLAFGSLIIAIVQFIRFILSQIQKLLQKKKEALVIRIILCLFQCCFWCLEKILRYVSRQAYIEIAMYGSDFCEATCRVANLLLRNILRTAVKDNIVQLLLFLGKLCIVGVVALIAWLLFGGYSNYGEDIWGRELNFYLLPILVLVVVAYLIASGFTGVFLMAVDTIFICFLEDLERNDGEDKPYFMDPELQKVMDIKSTSVQHGTEEETKVTSARLGKEEEAPLIK
ncbi:choline transporter-like protein 2 [Dysidea avara]|uniref:choline transporter-like protein 2 n=1 Tax=Dysidea avara TaxID=196820 RepID=UPI00331A5EF2